jgi:hypothetical protein
MQARAHAYTPSGYAHTHVCCDYGCRGVQAGLYTSWQDYEGDWEDKPISAHVHTYTEQLEAAKELQPLHVNVHSGQVPAVPRAHCDPSPHAPLLFSNASIVYYRQSLPETARAHR